MRPPRRAVLALLVAVPLAFGLGVSLAPDPVGFVSVVVGTVLTIVFATVLYRVIPADTGGSAAN